MKKKAEFFCEICEKKSPYESENVTEANGNF